MFTYLQNVCLLYVRGMYYKYLQVHIKHGLYLPLGIGATLSPTSNEDLTTKRSTYAYIIDQALIQRFTQARIPNNIVDQFATCLRDL